MARENGVDLIAIRWAQGTGALPIPFPVNLAALCCLAALGFAVEHGCEYLGKRSHFGSLLVSNFPADLLGFSQKALIGERVCSLINDILPHICCVLEQNRGVCASIDKLFTGKPD